MNILGKNDLEQRMVAHMDGLEKSIKGHAQSTKADLKSTEQRKTIILGGLMAAGVGILGILIGLF